jgi:hypothetical protein
MASQRGFMPAGFKHNFNVGLIIFVSLAASSASVKCLAQESNQRTIFQSQTGLVRPSGTYIGPGTMSNSARGVYASGAQVNPSLPRVNLGANVATPGDNQYGPNPTQVRAPAPQNTGSNPNLPSARLGANIGMAGDNMRTDLGGNQPQYRAAPQRQYYRTPNYYYQQPQQAPQSNTVGTYEGVVPKQQIHF